MLTVKYFAYGSNIDIDRLKGRVEFFGDPLVNGDPYTLEGYDLVFNAGMEFTTHAFANIVPRNGAKVEGILYDMTPAQFRRLDNYEMLYEKQYFQIDEDTIGCVYIAKEDSTCRREKKPDLGYLNIIIDGCKKTGLKATYNKLAKFKSTNYKLKKGSRHKFFTAI